MLINDELWLPDRKHPRKHPPRFWVVAFHLQTWGTIPVMRSLNHGIKRSTGKEKRNMKHPCTLSVDDLADDSGVFSTALTRNLIVKGCPSVVSGLRPRAKELALQTRDRKNVASPGNYFNVDTKSGCSGIRLVHNRNRVDQEVEQNVAVIYGIYIYI